MAHNGKLTGWLGDKEIKWARYLAQRQGLTFHAWVNQTVRTGMREQIRELKAEQEREKRDAATTTGV